MSKTGPTENKRSFRGEGPDDAKDRELTDEDLDKVSGGYDAVSARVGKFTAGSALKPAVRQ